MTKSCCAVGCANRHEKGSGIKFYRLPKDKARKALWIAAIGRKVAWQPTVHTWLCSSHFIGCKNDDPLSPDYIPSLFTHTRSPIKREKTAESVERYERSAECT